MNIRDKSKSELMEELQKLQKEHDEMKAHYKKDISDLRKAEEKLKNSEERLSEVLNNSMDAAYKRNLVTSGYEYCSPVFARLSGYSPEEMNALPIETVLELMHPDDIPMVKRTLDEAISKGTGSTHEVEYRFRHKDGRYRWFFDRFTVVTDSHGQPSALIGTVTDITVDKHVEETLKTSRKILKLSLESQKDTVFFCVNPEYQYLYFNKAHSDIIKYAYDKDIKEGMNILECLTSEKEKKPVKENIDRVLKGESFSIVQMFGDADPFYYEGFYDPILNDDGTIIGATILGRNITDRKKTEEELSKTKIELEQFFNLVPDLVTVASTDGRFIKLNKEWENTLGYSVPELMSKPFISLIHPDDLDKTKEVVFKELGGRKAIRIENRYRHKNGSYRWLEWNTTPPMGNILYAAARDITEKKKTEQALVESEEKYRVLLNGSSYGILATDMETHRFLFSNPAMSKLFGYTDEEFRLLNIEDMNPKESIDWAMSEFEAHMRGLKSISFAIPCQKKDGTIFYADIAGAPIVLNGRKCSVGFFMDVTERKQTEETLKESEERLRESEEQQRAILRTALDGFWMTDLQGCLLEVNEAYCQMSGYTYKELLTMRISDLEVIENRSNTEKHIKKIVEIGEDRFESHHRRKDGSVFNIEISVQYKQKDGGRLVAFLRDITRRKQSEMELMHAKEKAEESDRLKSAFLANMSHEIRTPMNGILGFAQLLKEPDLTGKEQQEYIRIIEKSGKRMLNIIHDIVDISKIESGQMEVSMSETNINDQVKYIYAFFTPEAEQKGIHFYFKHTLSSKESIIKTDREKIYAILTNLVKNAIKFTNTGSIEFGYEIKGKYLEFYVKDTGIGIPQDRQEAIFHRFVQGDISNKRAHDGAGLGLSIAKGYVEMLGGTIWVESEPGKGATFYFTIPYNAEPEKTGAILQENSGDDIPNLIKNLKILLVEDDEDSEMLIKKVIEKISPEILIANTGAEAMVVFRANPDIDLILMDIRMPDLNGYEATRQIRQLNKDVIIIAQTAFALSGDREKALAAGCNDYITKPLNLTLLFGLINKYFNK